MGLELVLAASTGDRSEKRRIREMVGFARDPTREPLSLVPWRAEAYLRAGLALVPDLMEGQAPRPFRHRRPRSPPRASAGRRARPRGPPCASPAPSRRRSTRATR
jgi:hypothetical protein